MGVIAPIEHGFDAQAAYPFPVVGFVGEPDNTLLAYFEAHPGVACVLTLQGDPDQRMRHLYGQLDRCRTLAGTFVVVLGLKTDREVDELRWRTDAVVFSVGPAPEITQVLPELHPSRPDSFYGCLSACIDPCAGFGPNIVA